MYKWATQEGKLADLVEAGTHSQADWAAGDFAVIGSGILLTAELLAEAIDVRAGWRLLDVGAGNGNMSLAAARRGCRVTSTDFVPALLERGKIRAEAEGWRIDFQVADAEQLPFEDESYDCVASTFGVMFAPDQPRAAAELLRVCRKGGKIGLANWTPESFVGRIFTLIHHYAPPPPGVLPPTLWGTKARMDELFADAKGIVIETRATKLRSRSDVDWMAGFRKYFGPLERTFAILDKTQQDSLEQDLLAMAREGNIAGDDTLVVPSEYLEIVITR